MARLQGKVAVITGGNTKCSKSQLRSHWAYLAGQLLPARAEDFNKEIHSWVFCEL